jgi:uncharacterized protein YciI
MKYFLVTYTHPNEIGWRKHLTPHINYLNDLLAKEKIVASGPLVNTAVKSAVILFKVANLKEVEDLVKNDPYTIEGQVGELSIVEWDPMFGEFQNAKHKIMLFLQKIFMR